MQCELTCNLLLSWFKSVRNIFAAEYLKFRGISRSRLLPLFGDISSNGKATVDIHAVMATHPCGIRMEIEMTAAKE